MLLYFLNIFLKSILLSTKSNTYDSTRVANPNLKTPTVVMIYICCINTTVKAINSRRIVATVCMVFLLGSSALILSKVSIIHSLLWLAFIARPCTQYYHHAVFVSMTFSLKTIYFFVDNKAFLVYTITILLMTRSFKSLKT